MKQTEQQVAKMVMDEKNVYEKATQDLRVEMQEIWKAMNGVLSTNVYPWEKPQFIPKMRTEVSFVLPFIFSGEPELVVDLVGDEDKATALVMDKILSYRTNNSSEVYDAMLAWVTQGVALGTSLLKVTWKFDPEKKIDRPIYEVPNILDIYTNPMIADVYKQRSMIEKISMTVGDVQKSPIYNNNKKKVKPSKSTDNYGSEAMTDVDLNDRDKLEAQFKTVDVYERWSEDRIITVADCQGGPILLRDEKHTHGKIPYIKFGFEREILPNRFYCKGVGQNTIGLQEMHYDLFNMVMLNLKIVVNKMWRVDPGTRLDPRDLVARPGGTVRATKEEAEPIEQTDLERSSFEMLGLISDEHKRASGATELIQGGSSSRTLGQDQLAQSNVSNRFELVRRGLKSALSKVGSLTLKMELDNLQSAEAEIMKIFPSSERKSIFDFIQSVKDNTTFDVTVRGDTILAMNRDILAKQMLDLYNLLAESLLPQEKRHFAQEIARLRGIKNVKDLIPDAPAPMPGMAPGMEGMPPGMQPGMEGGPVDGNAMPEMGGGLTQEGINEQTYGFETPNSRQ